MAIDKAWLQNVINSGIPQRQKMVESQDYYNADNTAINGRTMTVYDVETKTNMIDPYKSNTKLPSGFHKLMIEQKVNYSLNDDMTAVVNKQSVEGWLGIKWKNRVQEAGREASINGFSLWQFYMDGSKVKYKAIPSEQITLCFDGDKNIVIVVRQYEMLDKGTGKEMTVAEVWDDTEHWTFENKNGKDWDCAKQEPHLVTQSTLGGTVIGEKGKGWGRVPFAIFINNTDCLTDLKPIKPFIDAYDLTNSDYANNLADFQDAYWVLKNFDGQNPGEFMDMVNRTKVVKVGDGGDANMETKEIPHEAKTVFLDRVKQDIFLFGMGVNADDIEGNVTNVRIKSMYSNLDLKANSFELNCTTFLEQALSFYEVPSDNLEVTYDRNMIMNNIELSTLANESIRAVSEETRLANDPRVKDVKLEIERMEQMNSSLLDEEESTVVVTDE